MTDDRDPPEWAMREAKLVVQRYTTWVGGEFDAQECDLRDAFAALLAAARARGWRDAIKAAAADVEDCGAILEARETEFIARRAVERCTWAFKAGLSPQKNGGRTRV